MNESKAKVEFSNGFVIKGMELRDYFAARAMQSLTMHYVDMFSNGTYEFWHEEMLPDLAEDAYSLADAMMKAREK